MLESLIAPELVWGLIPRFVGVVYVIAFAGIAPQIVGLLGRNGIGHITPRLDAARRDFSGIGRFLMFPSAFWIASSDRALRAIPLIGIACGLICIFGGPAAPFAHALAWFLWLSMEPAVAIFPWDTMLQEVGFLVLFLPTPLPLPDLHASSLPFPTVAFVFRFFVLRLMLGFGKVKFVGTKANDKLYLRGFFVWAPSPTPLAWYAHRLPAWILRNMLYFMFVAEVIAPLLGFFSGPLRLVSFALLTMLMVGIQVTGNWGFFNIGYMLLCVCLLDTKSSIMDLAAEPWASTLWELPQLLLNPLMVLIFLTMLVNLVVLDSWTTRTVVRLPLDRYMWNRPWLRAIVAYLRAIGPFRIINGYGVFPPSATAPMRQTLVFEGSDDGTNWKAYRFRFMPTSARERPRFVAPYHARIDMASYYGAGGLHDGSIYGSFVGDGMPYSCYAHASWLDRLCQRLLHGEPSVLGLLGTNPFPDAPPKLMRVSLMAMTVARPAVRRATGEWWHTKRLGLMCPPRGKEDWVEELSIPHPETFHPDWVDYKRRSAPLKAMVRAYLSGVEPNRAVLTETDLTESEVRAFWEELVPCLSDGRGDYTRRVEKAEELMNRFGKLKLARFERLLERFSWLLRIRTERHQFADAQPNLPIASNFRYHMFVQELVTDGQAAYEKYLTDVAAVVKRLDASTDETQLWTLTMLRHELMMAHAGVFRRTDLGRDVHRMGVHGLFEYYPIICQFVPPGEEFVPEVVKLPTGEHTVAGFYPPPLPALRDAEPRGDASRSAHS